MRLAGSPATASYFSGSDIYQASSAAAVADVAIVVVATLSSEGKDRPNLQLDGNQDELVRAIASVQRNTVVVVRAPGAMLLPWASQVPSIVLQMMAGQEAGNALASVLFGEVNPSGRLPLSFPVSESDTWLNTEEQVLYTSSCSFEVLHFACFHALCATVSWCANHLWIRRGCVHRRASGWVSVV